MELSEGESGNDTETCFVELHQSVDTNALFAGVGIDFGAVRIGAAVAKTAEHAHL